MTRSNKQQKEEKKMKKQQKKDEGFTTMRWAYDIIALVHDGTHLYDS